MSDNQTIIEIHYLSCLANSQDVTEADFRPQIISALSKPCTINLLGSLLLGGGGTWLTGLAVNAGGTDAFITYATMAAVTAFQRSYDTSDPTAPAFIGALAAGLDHNSFGIALLVGNTLFVSSALLSVRSDLTAIDVTAPAAPVRLSDLSLLGWAGNINGMAITGNNLLAVKPSNISFRIIDVTDPTAMVLLADYNTVVDFTNPQVGPVRVAASGVTAYILSYDSVTPEAIFGIYDVTDPLVVLQLSTLQVSVNLHASLRRAAILLASSYAFVIVDDDFVILDVTNPAAPVIVSTTALIADTGSIGSDDALPLAINALETRAYILNKSARTMSVYNISDKTAPALLDTQATHATSSPECVVYNNGFIFVAESERPTGSTQAWLEIFDASLCQ